MAASFGMSYFATPIVALPKRQQTQQQKRMQSHKQDGVKKLALLNSTEDVNSLKKAVVNYGPKGDLGYQFRSCLKGSREEASVQNGKVRKETSNPLPKVTFAKTAQVRKF